MTNKDKFKEFLHKHTKGEAKEKVEHIFNEADEKAKNGVHDVEGFFEKIGHHVKDGSHEIVEKAKEEIKKFKK